MIERALIEVLEVDRIKGAKIDINASNQDVVDDLGAVSRRGR